MKDAPKVLLSPFIFFLSLNKTDFTISTGSAFYFMDIQK